MTDYCWIKVTEGGRVVIPSRFRESSGILPGDDLLLAADADGLRLLTLRQAVTDVQALVAKFVPDAYELQADLKALRSAEFAKDQRDS